jgi:hypothetical protein
LDVASITQLRLDRFIMSSHLLGEAFVIHSGVDRELGVHERRGCDSCVESAANWLLRGAINRSEKV